MLIKKSKTILILAFTLIIFVCFSLAATAIEAPYENVSIGDVIILSVGIYSESIGDDTSPVFDSQTQNYSEFLEYAEQHGLVEPGKYSSLDADATRLDAVVILYPALSENQYTIINNDFTIPDMSPAQPYYDYVYSFYQSGIFVGSPGAYFQPNQPITQSELQSICQRMALPETRLSTVSQDTTVVKQAYRLAITHSMDNSKEGIQSGWEIDNRAGNLKLALGGNSVLTDIMTDEKSRMIRYFNEITDEKIEIRARLTYSYNFNGNVIELCDETGSPAYRLVNSDGAFCIQNANGSLTPIYTPPANTKTFNFRITVDLEKGTGTTAINNVSYGTYPLLGDTVKYFAYSTSDETSNVTNIGASYMYANYAVYENLDLTTGIPYDMQYSGNVSNSSGSFLMSSASQLSRSFDALNSEAVFSFNTYLPSNAGNVSYSLRSGNSDVVTITANNGYFYANGVQLKEFSDKLWYKMRIEANPVTQTADIKINAKVVATVPFLSTALTFDNISFSNGGTAQIKLDDIQVYNLYDYYVPAPVIPEGADDYTIGLNVCSLWVNGDHWGWATVSPYEDMRPVLGYYDEGIPEVADWENKFMAEHGIDFQAFCWYANETNAPMKTTRLSDQLDEAYLHSKYGNTVKFCLLWEAANASRPANSEAFRNYYVPYWIENYFSDPRYMTIDNKLVFSIFGVDNLISQFGTSLKNEFDYMREEVKKLGFDGMIITASHTGRNDLAAYGFDAWQAYNWGTSGYSVNTNINNMNSVRVSKDVYTIPTVSVGFNSIPWHGERYPLMSVEDYRTVHEYVRDVYLPAYSNENDWTHNLLWLSTWNEYGEGTYIMPAEDLNGFGYLDVLRSVYTDAAGTHTDAVPTEEQKSHFNHLYPQDRRILRAYGNYIPLPDNEYDDTPVTYDFTVSGNYANYITLSNMGGVVGTDSNGTTFVSNSTNPDAILVLKSSLYSGFTCDQIASIKVVASGIPEGQRMQLFYQTDAAPALSEENSLSIISESTAEREYEFIVGAEQGWSGNIRYLRLDPLQLTNTQFTIKSITVVPRVYVERPNLYVNNLKVENSILPEFDDNGTWYFPFEPGKSYINFLLYTYHEWDYDTETLTLYRDGKCFKFTAGSEYALVDGVPVLMDGAVYLVDNIPMLPIESLAEILGFECVKTGNDYYYTTPEEYIFEEYASDTAIGEWNFNIIGSSSGWSSYNTTFGYGDGTIILTSDNNDPIFFSPENLGLDCEEYSKIEIRCRWNNTGGYGFNMGFYFITEADPNWTQAKSQHQSMGVSSNGEFVTLTYDMSQNSAWNGTLKQLRFDPFDAPGTVEIDYIRFID